MRYSYTAALSATTIFWSFDHTAAQENRTELDVNFLNLSYECSHGDAEWMICTQPQGWGSMFYCPAHSEYNETELALVQWGSIGVYTPLMPCFACPEVGSNCTMVVNETLTASNIAEDQLSVLAKQSIWEEASFYCRELCEKNKEGETCNQDSQCTPGELFCDYSGDTDYTDGTCKPCPSNPDECFGEGFATSDMGRHNCRDCNLYCYGAAASKFWVDEEALVSQPIDIATQTSNQSASGVLHDCSDLILNPKNICPGAEGKICVIYFKQQFAITWQVSDQAEKSGCVGIVAFELNNIEVPMSHSFDKLLIPYVYVAKEDGLKLLNEKIGKEAKLEVNVFGGACYPTWESKKCSNSWPCDTGEYCDFKSVPSGEGNIYLQGNCIPCPQDENGESDPLACYFDSRNDGKFDVETIMIKTVQKVEECASTCEAQLSSNGCKFCTSEVTGFDFTVENEEDRCIFCPEYDMIYPDRVVPLFGPSGVKCWQLEQFFQNLPVPKNSRNCELSQSMNFICGCDGAGYAGANSTQKQAVLVWLPRVASILSMLGSLFIIYDTQKTFAKRQKTINKIMLSTSAFDFMGSFAMAFTSLPTPELDYIYGGKGNDATCKAQGFFIQMGTCACFLGVSLAIYYNLTIKHGWPEAKLKRKRAIYFLTLPPILIGLIFAGIGIPYYDNVIVWCNYSAKYWPEIPVVIAILLVTFLMADVWYCVHKKEKKSSRYTGGSKRLSKMVIRQASFFVGAFYITWVPYLALQFLVSSGTGYTIYGLFLAAATMVPLQGFWNFIVYVKPRYIDKGIVATSVANSLRAQVSKVGNLHSRKRSIFKNSSGTDTNTISKTTKVDHQAGLDQEGLESCQKADASLDMIREDEPEIIPFDPNSVESENKLDYNMLLAG